MSTLRHVAAYQVYDSRGCPTVECEVTLADGARGRGLVPSGASTGQFEARELRDNNPAQFRGRSVFQAIHHIEQALAPAVIGMDAAAQEEIDRRMIALDGTPTKSRLGANAILGVSMAVANAAAASRGIPLFRHLGPGTLLPLPEIQILGGGAHAGWRTDVQDFLVIATGAQSFPEVMEITHNIYHAAADCLRERKGYYGVADEGGYWPDFETNEAALELLTEAIHRAGYTPGQEASLALDIAASDLYNPTTGQYRFALENRSFSREAFADLMIRWSNDYAVISLEDPMADSDWDGWQRVADSLRTRVQLVGDDLFTTNPRRIEQGISRGIANAVLIKPNQIGTVTETIEAVRLTQQAGWLPIISARSGETEDAFIAHLAVATDAGQRKVGAFARSERMVKWNEVLRIERALGRNAQFVGARIYDRTRPPLHPQRERPG